jgi:MFS family permease
MLISLIGTWMQSVGEAWLVLKLTNDPVALGIVAACAFGPVLVLGLFGGIVADSVSKRKALYVTQVVAGLLALTTGTLVATGVVQVWMIYVIALLLGVNSSFDMPIRQSFVVEMVGREDIGKAVALNSAVFNMSRIVGPAIGGLTIAAFGIAPLYFLNALSYIAVIFSLWRMRPEEFHAVPHMEVVRTARGIFDRLAEGLRYVRNNEQILLAISILTVVSTFSMNFNVLGPLLAANVLHGDADTYGFLMAASGAGSLAGALLIAFGARPTMMRLISGTFVAGVGLLLLSLSSSFGPDLVLMFVIGWGTISMAATCNTIIQLNVPDVLRGRVMSVYTTLFAGTTPIGGLFSGAVAAAAGVPAALGIGGIVALGSSAVGYWRTPERPEFRPIALLAGRNARHR